MLPRRLQDFLLARAGDHQQRQRRRGVLARLGIERVHQRLGLPGGEVAVAVGLRQHAG